MLMPEDLYREIALKAAFAARELIAEAQPRAGGIFVVGCSTSEILGCKIGTNGSEEAAAALWEALQAVAEEHELFLAAQCCEHLNRALVIDRAALDRYSLQEVTVRPMPHAGGSFAAAAYDGLSDPAVVGQVQGQLGMDIGQTLIGMHLKPVAVPVRLSMKKIGEAVLTAARTRPPLIGGARACYPRDIR